MALFDFVLGTPERAYDPYEQDRAARMGVMQQRQGDLSSMQGRPYYALEPEVMRYLEGMAEEDVRSRYPGAAQSGWLNDQTTRAKLNVRLATLDRAMKERQQQRELINQLAMGSQPTQRVGAEPGAAQQLGSSAVGAFGGELGKAAGEWGKSLFGGTKGPQQSGVAAPSGKGGGFNIDPEGFSLNV